MNALESSLVAIDAVVENAHGAEIIAATARGLMAGYDARWKSAEWKTVSLEEQFHLPLVNPQTGRASRTWTHAGKYDGIVTYSDGGKFYLLEHKTVSEDIADPNASYWRRLVIDSQVSGYVLANWQNERKLDGTLYDCIRKPGIRPRQITKVEQRTIVSLRKYCDHNVTDETITAVTGGLERENGELFGIRLAAETIAEPDKYFQRRTIPRLDSEVLEFAEELWQTADEIRLARNSGRFYRNSGACMQWNRPCIYLGLCSGHDTEDSDKWIHRPQNHEELTRIHGDGRSILTHSSMSCFKLCHRKFRLRYEEGIERRDEEEAEALFFGTVFHEALAAWWGCFLLESEKSNGTSSDSSPANAAGEPGAGEEIVAG